MKKMISILTACTLLASAIPTAVFAADTTADTVQTASTEQTAKNLLDSYIEAYKPEGIKSMTPAESIENVDRNFAKRNTKPLEKITYSTADELVNGILNGKSAEEVFGENVKVSAELNSGVNGSSDFLVVYGLKSKNEISGIMNKFYQELNFDYVTTLCEFRSGIDFRLYSDRLETHAISVFVFVNDENPSYVTETSIADFTGNLGFNPSKYIITFGDTNGDYVIDSTDASDVLSLYAKLSTDKDLKATDEQLKHYDTNADGVIDASDASNILAYYSYVSTGGKFSLKDFLNL